MRPSLAFYNTCEEIDALVAAIWASDDLEYGGGGATHSSAFNYFHNLMAARLAG